MDPGFTSEASLSSTRPHTPPYTPHHRNKGKRTRLAERSDSPASSIHPTETVSPPKKHQAKRLATTKGDSVQVEELAEGDPAYLSDIDIVYPASLEEASGLSTANSDYGDDELSCASGDNETWDAVSDAGRGITRGMSRLRCDDEAEFEAGRRQRRLSKRVGSRAFKRSHSQSVKGEETMEEVTDPDQMDDQDLEASRRRLRRRVRGPEDGTAVVFEDAPRSSPDPGSVQRGVGVGAPMTPEQDIKGKTGGRRGEGEIVMDVDEMSE